MLKRTETNLLLFFSTVKRNLYTVNTYMVAQSSSDKFWAKDCEKDLSLFITFLIPEKLPLEVIVM